MSVVRRGLAAGLSGAVAIAGCSGSQALLPQGVGLAPAGKGTVLIAPWILGCKPTHVTITRQDGVHYRMVARVVANSRANGARASAVLDPGTYHIGAAWCLLGNSTGLRVSAPHGSIFLLTEPDTFTGSLASFTVEAGEVVDIGALWFDKPSATSDQGSVVVVTSADAGTIADMEKEQPQLKGRIVVRPAVAIKRNDLPKS